MSTRKGCQREIDERRGCVARLLARGVPKMTIHRYIRQKFNRQWRTVDRDITWLTHLEWEPEENWDYELSR